MGKRCVIENVANEGIAPKRFDTICRSLGAGKRSHVSPRSDKFTEQMAAYEATSTCQEYVRRHGCFA